MSKSPAFQFYPKDFLSDQKVLLMSPEVRGMYITLLCIDWLEDGIPENPKVFMKLAGYDSSVKEGFSEAREQIEKCFKPHPKKDGFITNPRLQVERIAQAKRRDIQSRSGKLGAENRWKKNAFDGKAILSPMGSDSSASASASSFKDKGLTALVNGNKSRPLNAEEVTEYAKSIGFSLDGNKFIDHYQKGGWVYGKGRIPIKDWKAAVRTWKHQQDGFGNGLFNGHQEPKREPSIS